MRKFNCPICNNQLKQSNISGSVFPWKDFNHVQLLVSFKALLCSKCGEILIQGKDTAELDQALEKSIRMQAAKFLLTIKKNSMLSQKALAKKIGLSEVYLSEIGSMKKTVSSQIFNFLKILANHPSTLLDLECFTGKSAKQSQSSMANAETLESDILLVKFQYIGKEKVQELKQKTHFESLLNTTHARGARH
ncbi:hypothetical protein ACQUW5_02355 [Legionella sp. CNM-1927-20]|uniref:hypothetical protein n=1 Tax=Legionella sp. CNM-1927-20 TaxID=3422221 RepID=UPI00403ADBA0